ncbi:MAG: phospholipase A [Gammaproteobacteria bacterium]|nr:phospholipase A [Gammaproteobacteria bacterium]
MPTYLTMALLLILVVFGRPAGADTPEAGSAIDHRQALEWENYDNPFSITPHRPTYILPLTYNDSPNEEPYAAANSDLIPEPNEIKFQFSFKVPLLENFLFGRGFFSFGYTQQSYWQAYKGRSSSPFRENNYEPELLFSFPVEEKVLGLNWRRVGLSLNHQSNGRPEPLSRSWNRVMLELVAERENLYVSLKPWWRLPESSGSDDNPDIEKYLGNFELRILQKYENHTFGLMLRNNLRSDNHGAAQFDYTFPINRRMRGYAQIFSGYGESLIDYDHYNNSIGVGVMLTNWL